MKVLHTIAGLSPNAGGPSRTVPRLCEALSELMDLQVLLLTQQGDNEPMAEVLADKVEFNIAYSRSKMALKLGWPMRGLIHQLISDQCPDLIHDHGIWLPTNYYAAAAARRYQIPLIIHLRGMLEPWSLDFRSWKKKTALLFYQRRNLETAVVFFATSPQELKSIRRLGLKQPVAIIPNGIDLPQKNFLADDLDCQMQSKRNIVFLGRIHPVKGLLNLVEAWVRLEQPDWCLFLAGPDEGGHLAEVMQRIRALGLDASVKYVGEVEGETKSALLESADLFVLPSFSENFGVVVAEALAHGVPVITTRGTPWEGLLRHGCGWWVEPTVDALSGALREALSMDTAALQVMGEKGRVYAAEFNWAHIAQQTAEVYWWVLGQGPKPACVVCD